MSQHNTIIESEEALHTALALCRGDYQRGLVRGAYALSGADLKGKARQYSARYKRSRDNLLQRLTDAGVEWCERTGKHGKRILVIGAEQ